METFRLIGEIADTETMAEGSSIRDLARLTRPTGAGNGANARGTGSSSYGTGPFATLSYTGTRRMA